MIIDALLAADPYLKIAQRVFKAEEYINTTDHIMSQIKNSREPVRFSLLLYRCCRNNETHSIIQELTEARAILRAISKRELYRHVDFKTIEWPLREIFRKHITPEKIVERVQSMFSTTDDVQDLQPSDVIVDFSTRSFGMREQNPVDHVLFYSKRNPTSAFPFVLNLVSNKFIFTCRRVQQGRSGGHYKRSSQMVLRGRSEHLHQEGKAPGCRSGWLSRHPRRSAKR